MALSILNDGPVTITLDSPKPQIKAHQQVQEAVSAGNEGEREEETERAD